jgi:transcriptional regulator with GAF, ATPase, and Fis domain
MAETHRADGQDQAGLSARRGLDHEAMWRAMRALVERVTRAVDGDDALDACLDVVVELLGADRGLVLVPMSDGTLRAATARRQRHPLTPHEREEVSKTIVRQALDGGQCVVWDEEAARKRSAGGLRGYASESVSTLGIRVALAAPILAAPGLTPRAVVYVDFRDPRKFVEDRQVEFFMTAAMVIGAVLDQHARAETTRAHLREARTHTVESRSTPPLADLLGPASMGQLRAEIDAAVLGTLSLFILGESGSGKTLLAHAIAEASGRRPIVRALLGGSDDLNTITSELFGHERGAFSGATSKRVGLVEFADKGTLILDEVLNMPAHAQRLLLDFTQFGTYRPLGYERPEPKRADVRIVAATNGDLGAAMRDGRFRADLYHRLAGVVLHLPPLRARREDIPALAESTLRRIDPARTWTLSVGLRRLLLSPTIAWSGNVRQLERVVARARERALSRDPTAMALGPEHLDARDLDAETPRDVAVGSPDAGLASAWERLQTQREQLAAREHEMIREALARSGGVVAHAARELGMARTTLASRIDVLGIRSARRDG